MKSLLILAGAAAVTVASPAFAGHLANLDTPYSSRGKCESAMAQFSPDDRDALLGAFPQFFQTEGDIAGFLTRAFSCELNEEDGEWYIEDRRLEALSSDWFQRRQR